MLVKNQDQRGLISIVKIRRPYLHNKHENVLYNRLKYVCVCLECLSWWLCEMFTVVSADTRLVSNRSEMTINPHTKPQRFRYTNSHASLLGDLWTVEQPLTCVSNRKWNNSPSRRTLRDIICISSHTQMSCWEIARWNANRKWFHCWAELAFKLWLPAEQSWRLNCGCHGDKTLTDTSITETH